MPVPLYSGNDQLAAIRIALEQAGVVFLDDGTGPGVKLRTVEDSNESPGSKGQQSLHRIADYVRQAKSALRGCVSIDEARREGCRIGHLVGTDVRRWEEQHAQPNGVHRMEVEAAVRRVGSKHSHIAAEFRDALQEALLTAFRE